MPKYVNNDTVSRFINNHLLKETTLVFEAQNLTIKPNYRLDVNLKADLIALKTKSGKDVLLLKEPNVDISSFALVGKYFDLNKINVEKIIYNITFKKDGTYDYLDYIKPEKKKSAFEFRNIHLVANQLEFNLYDQNVSKKYSINSSNFKLNLDDINKPIKISSNGKIFSEQNKLSDYKLALEIKTNKDVKNEFRKKLLTFNYSPFIYADKFAFNSFIDINLKSYNLSDKNHLDGEVNLKDYSFILDGNRLPKNNLLMKFKGDKIFVNSNFNLVKNQFIKTEAIISHSKNKYIEAKLNSNEIDLKDFIKIAGAYAKILNSKMNYDDFDLKGKMNADLYLKSNFKTISSKGKLIIEDAQLFHKKTGLEINNINSNIDLANNKVNIKNTSALIGLSKFYLVGSIDEKTNLNLKINSDDINIAKVINFLKSFPMTRQISPFLDKHSFKTGLIKIDSQISGVLNKPIVQTRTKLNNIKVYSKKLKTDFVADTVSILANPEQNKFNDILLTFNNLIMIDEKYCLKIPSLKMNISENDIKIHQTKGEIKNLPFDIVGNVKNYKSGNVESSFNIVFDNLKNNEIVKIKNTQPKINSNITIKNNRIHFNKFDLIDTLTNTRLAYALGSILIEEDKAIFENFKIFVPSKISLYIPKYKIDYEVDGNVSFAKEVTKPSIQGKLNISNLFALNNNLCVSDAFLLINDFNIYANILNGSLYEQGFSSVIQSAYKNNKFVISDLEFNVNYLNLLKIINSNKITQKETRMQLPEIEKINGNILKLESDSFSANNINFVGEYRNDILNISKFNSLMYDGSASGKLQFNFTNNETSIESNVENINVRSVSQQIKDFSIAASGRLDAFINAKIIGLDFNSILKTFDGDVEFTIKDGELSQLAKFERFLQAGNILSQSILKLSLNSALSLVSKQNTGDFKIIQGKAKVINSIANVEYIKTQGTNMSLYLTGKYNLLNNNASFYILGRIPLSTVDILGNVGRFTLNDSVEKMTDETKTIIKTITFSPVEKMLSQKVSSVELEKIPNLAYKDNANNTREFVVNILGDIKNISSIKSFKWAIKE